MVRTAKRICMQSLGFALPLALSASLGFAAEKIDHEALATYKKVTWEDFRGPVVRGQQAAWIASTIVVDPYDVAVSEEAQGSRSARMKHVDVYSLMDKLESSARTGARDPRNLDHEQIHFDIAEIHARRLHARLSELVVRSSVSASADDDSVGLRVQLEQAVQLAWEEEMRAFNEHQARYDGDTVHGTKKGKQKKWAELVAEELAAEEPYPLR